MNKILFRFDGVKSYLLFQIGHMYLALIIDHEI